MPIRPLSTLLARRQGKTRLSKWYVPFEDDEKVRFPLSALTSSAGRPADWIEAAPSQVRLRGEVHRLIAPRDQKYQSNFVEVSQAPAHTARKSG